MSKYADHIKDRIDKVYAGDPRNTLGRCLDEAKIMKNKFPELTLIKGHVYAPPPWGKRAHWWLTTPEGEIVDPTRGQFPPLFDSEYEPFKDGDDVRLGKCMNCGKELWGHPGDFVPYTCSEECRLKLVEGFNRPHTQRDVL